MISYICTIPTSNVLRKMGVPLIGSQKPRNARERKINMQSEKGCWITDSSVWKTIDSKAQCRRLNSNAGQCCILKLMVEVQLWL